MCHKQNCNTKLNCKNEIRFQTLPLISQSQLKVSMLYGSAPVVAQKLHTTFNLKLRLNRSRDSKKLKRHFFCKFMIEPSCGPSKQRHSASPTTSACTHLWTSPQPHHSWPQTSQANSTSWPCGKRPDLCRICWISWGSGCAKGSSCCKEGGFCTRSSSSRCSSRCNSSARKNIHSFRPNSSCPNLSRKKETFLTCSHFMNQSV